MEASGDDSVSQAGHCSLDGDPACRVYNSGSKRDTQGYIFEDGDDKDEALNPGGKKIHKGEFPPWIAANWGSDIYLYGRLSEYEERIRAVMSACDYYLTECHRDVELAREFGFKGEGFSVLPSAGGFSSESTSFGSLAQPPPGASLR